MQCKPISEFIYSHAFVPAHRLTSLLGCGTRTNTGLCKWNGCVCHSWTRGSQSSGRVKICSKNSDGLCQADSASEGWGSKTPVWHLDFFPFFFPFRKGNRHRRKTLPSPELKRRCAAAESTVAVRCRLLSGEIWVMTNSKHRYRALRG